MFVMRGGVYLYTGQTRDPRRRHARQLLSDRRNGRLFGIIPYPAVIAIVLLVVFVYVMRHRPFGRQIYAVGGNPEVARLAGYDVRRVKFICFIISALLADRRRHPPCRRASARRVHVAGLDFEFQVVAAVVLGGVSLAGGIGSLLGMALGVLILSVPVQRPWHARPADRMAAGHHRHHHHRRRRLRRS